ncbi:sec-independent translocase [Nocardioides mesophilus]|uniref:Twin-arginine translocase TatA/TatE family subunit n=1 Tax=Nocardioides mesophilus TaxID=433659 RepID=A0A7G9R809_9ACTN|nr:sec-independent translocase [Nocardioides mesophilus]QNN51734.1 twin-arginine translocase TatA/TatE family subunit [Nocardioides mesophilus]
MFGVGLPEMVVIVVVAVLIFGPDRLPDFARQAGRMIRQVRAFSQAARDDIRSELGPEFSNFELTDLDPRRAVRKYIQDTWDETPEERTDRPGQRPLRRDERPPYDSDAT